MRPLPILASIARAEKARKKIDASIDVVLDQPCPSCGHRSVIIEDAKMDQGIVIYCERAFCSWKPPFYNR